MELETRKKLAPEMNAASPTTLLIELRKKLREIRKNEEEETATNLDDPEKEETTDDWRKEYR